ncbi:MAG: magnesium-dependent phosphatase-1 [Desulfurococcales archaeon]|nr:magnesium-dependent phosphatase-1 [Desulfurococcales archaeon]
MDPWLLFVDLDGTMWDNPDISMLTPPFRRIDSGVIVDSNGVVVRLYTGMARLVEWARESNAITSTLSWNEPSIAIEALKAFGLLGLFDYIAIEPHPYKGDMAIRVLERVRKERGLKIPACRIVYIDDRDIHLDDMVSKLGDIVFLRAWVDFKGVEDAITLILNGLSRCG